MEAFNLYDYATKFLPDGKEAPVAKVLTQTNPVIKDAPVIESNSDAGHQYSIQTAMPKNVWRRAYQGVPATKGSYKMVTETFGLMSGLSEVDKTMAEKGGNVKAVRAQMLDERLESMAQDAAKKIIYGSKEDDEKAFIGFAARYSALSDAYTSRQVINNGGTGDGTLTSIYLIGWAPNKIFTFFPKGTKAGIEVIDYSKNGPIFLLDEKGQKYPGYSMQAEWKIGMGVQDWRFGARVCNIKMADLNTKDAKVALYENFIKALGRIQNLEACNLVAYCHRDVKDALRAGYLASGGVTVYQNNYGTSSGNKGYANHDLIIDGIAIKAEDAIELTEKQVK